MSGSLGWGLFAFQPLAEEKTPNYFGVGPDLVFGFSFHQMFDVAGFATYTPGCVGSAKVGQENASLSVYGGQLSLRLRKKIFMGLRGGSSDYQLTHSSGQPFEESGRWLGPGGGLTLGAIFPVDKRNFWQVNLDFMHFETVRTPALSPEAGIPNKRAIDFFRIGFTYTFNGFINHSVEDSMFRNVF